VNNPLLGKLGFDSDQVVVIFHCDDIGMCQSTIPAYEDLLDFGLITSASTMVPCPWFPAVADLCKKNSAIDMGVHITLTSEWDKYRWRPINTSNIEGLTDKSGFFHAKETGLWSHANVDAVKQEAKAQIDTAIFSGINVSHLDSHMLSLQHGDFASIYRELGDEYSLPVMLQRLDFLKKHKREDLYANAMKMENLELPLLDSWVAMSYVDSTQRVEQAKAILSQLKPGIHFFMLHPSIDSPELRGICSGTEANIRVADYQAMLSTELKSFVRQKGIQTISFEPINKLIN
jgi:predicted glycoside hydrolase/deacetylase ChbG (UPF0249 family)